jgi:hypothetical protein
MKVIFSVRILPLLTSKVIYDHMITWESDRFF